MQEDNLDKWLAKNLRRHQEKDPVPYEEGAWEAFQSKRSGTGFKFTYWAGGIAASLLIFLVSYLSLNLGKPEDPVEEGNVNLSEERIFDSAQEKLALAEESPIGENKIESLVFQQDQTPSSYPQHALKSEKETFKAAGEKGKKEQPVLQSTEEKDQVAQKETSVLQPTQAQGNKESMEQKTAGYPLVADWKGKSTEDSLTQAKVEELKKQIAELTQDEEEKPADVDDYRSRTLSLGLSPGLSSSQSDNQSISGTSLGLGAQVNWKLGEKLALGSGMGVNFFNQSTQGESVVEFANAAYPVSQEVNISQVQVDIPLYVTYPVNRRQSIAIQAGFSNLVAFTSSAQQESSYLRQVAVFDAQSTSSNDFTLRSESVSNLSEVSTPSSRFLPLATANLGINFVVLESKKAAYLLMPFYNYPIQDISGTGNNPGFFGAALKVNLGMIQKK